MKRAFLLLLPVVLFLVLASLGCNDESEPRFARITVYPACGVAPLEVDCRAEATGGNETGSPTGGNNNLEITWDFGDGGTSNTSITYHTFPDSGLYNVVVTATDPDGKTASTSQMVQVYLDTLKIEPSTNLGLAATTSDTVHFDLRAVSCFVDPDNDEDYRNLTFRWEMNDGSGSIFRARQPRYHFADAQICTVTVAVGYPALSLIRHASLIMEITDP